jgi:hypothetical protein
MLRGMTPIVAVPSLTADELVALTRELVETVWESGLLDRERAEGETVVFGPGYVHDVRNQETVTAVSVHAYSPPLRLMHYYDPAAGGLVRRASSWTDDPEAPAPASLERAS